MVVMDKHNTYLKTFSRTTSSINQNLNTVLSVILIDEKIEFNSHVLAILLKDNGTHTILFNDVRYTFIINHNRDFY